MQTSRNLPAAAPIGPTHESSHCDSKGAAGGKSTQFIELMQRALAAVPRPAPGQPVSSPAEASPTDQASPHLPSQHVVRPARTNAPARGATELDSVIVPAGCQELHSLPLPLATDGGAAETETADDTDCEAGADEPAIIPVATMNPTVMPFVCALVPAPEVELPSEEGGSLVANCASTTAPATEAESDAIPRQLTTRPDTEEGIPAKDEPPAVERAELPPASLAGEASAPPAIAASPETEESVEAGVAMAIASASPEATEAAPEAPRVKVERSAVVIPQATPQADGTSAAQVVAVMKKVEKQDEFAAPEKEMPGDQALSPTSGLGTVHASRADLHESFVAFAASADESTVPRTAPVSEASLVNLTADHRISALERTHDVIAMHALRLRTANAESIQIVIKPGGGLELSLELQRREGAIEARAAMQAGDFNHLNRHWADLQQRLEVRGIKLAPLTCADQFLNNSANNFQQQRERTSRNEAAMAEAFPPIVPAAASVITTAPQAARSTGRGWESWA